MIKFSEERQSFFETEFNYGTNTPTDLVDVPDEETHLILVDKLNKGHHVFSNLSFSEPKPDTHYVWQNGAWVDAETVEEKNARFLRSLAPLSRRQFMLVLVDNNLDEAIEPIINGIADIPTRKHMLVEYKESTSFERLSPIVAQMAALMGLTDDQVNQMWMYGLSL